MTRWSPRVRQAHRGMGLCRACPRSPSGRRRVISWKRPVVDHTSGDRRSEERLQSRAFGSLMQHAGVAAEVMVDIMRDPATDARTRADIAKFIYEQLNGKAAVKVDIDAKVGLGDSRRRSGHGRRAARTPRCGRTVHREQRRSGRRRSPRVSGGQAPPLPVRHATRFGVTHTTPGRRWSVTAWRPIVEQCGCCAWAPTGTLCGMQPAMVAGTHLVPAPQALGHAGA